MYIFAMDSPSKAMMWVQILSSQAVRQTGNALPNGWQENARRCATKAGHCKPLENHLTVTKKIGSHSLIT